METNMNNSNHKPADAHAKYSPSAAARWSICPSAPTLTARLREQGVLPERDEDTIHSQRGTVLHEVLSLILGHHDNEADEVLRANADRFEGETYESMRKLVDLALDAMLDTLGRQHDAHLERRYSIKEPFEVSGTSDYSVVRPGEVIICDAKFGRIPVYADGNKQLALYAFMASKDAGVEVRPDADVVGAIVQPLVDGSGVRTDVWRTDMATVTAMVEEMAEAVRLGEQDDLTLTPGETQCKYCPARLACPSLAALASTLIQEMKDMETLTPTQIAEFYDRVKLLAGVEDAIKAGVLDGRIKEGFETRAGARRETWTKDEATIEALSAEVGTISIYSQQLIPIKSLDGPVKARAKELGAVVETQNKPSVRRTKAVDPAVSKAEEQEALALFAS